MKIILRVSITVVGLVFFVTLLFGLADSIGKHFPSSLYISLLIAGVASLVAIFVTCLWAIPMHLILNKFNRRSYFWYLILAIVPSFFFIYVFRPFGKDSARDLVIQAMSCSVIGSIGAFVFWYIVVYKQHSIG